MVRVGEDQGAPILITHPFSPDLRTYTHAGLPHFGSTRFGRASRPSPVASVAVRGLALAAIAGAIAVPLLRKKHRIGPVVTTAVAFSGPLGLAILKPRTKARDAALYGLQMWAFNVVHELPYDDPEKLRERLLIKYPITIDKWLGAGELPGVRLQRLLARENGEVTVLDRVLVAAHWAWFIWPHAVMVYILTRRNKTFARAARQMAATYDIGALIYCLAPTAPPWWASENGYLSEDEELSPELRRVMLHVGEHFWGPAWPHLFQSFNGNPWAAMPSLHFAAALMAALLLSETGNVAGAVGWSYALTLGFALVYLGEHYLTDVLAGALLVAAVRKGEPLVEPLALRMSAGIQNWERIANAAT